MSDGFPSRRSFSGRADSRRGSLGRVAWGAAIGIFLVCFPALATDPEPVPFQPGERLTYEITWPSGLALGETEFTARGSSQSWTFQATIKADLPTLEIRDEYHSKTDASLCSLELEKKAARGDRKTGETVTFDQESHVARRETHEGGGESELEVPACARDGLTFLYFLRRELGRGRIPPPDDVNFGAQYQVSITYAESREIQVGSERRMADKILIDLTGPATQHSFEIFFGQDAARTPLLMRIPFELGTFSLKLVQ